MFFAVFFPTFPDSLTRGGLQEDDVILAINGIETAGKDRRLGRNSEAFPIIISPLHDCFEGTQTLHEKAKAVRKTRKLLMSI